MSKNEKGQTIVAVILLLIMGLGIGITLSFRNISKIRQQTRQDNASRALAVAEAAVERMLSKDYQDLVNYINFGNCDTNCTLDIMGDDGVNAHAEVTLSMAGSSSDPHEIWLTTDSVVEASLEGYPQNTDVFICWNDPSSGDKPSIAGYLLKGTSGNYDVDSFAYNSVGSSYTSNGFDDAVSEFGYTNCATINSSTDPISLRIKSIYNDVIAFVVPEAGINLPSQGILVESVGSVLDNEKKVEVLVSNPHLPAVFDYVLYQRSDEIPLSN